MNVEVVLIQDDPSLGRRGDVVRVSPGHAHNFLIPQKKAKLATPETLKLFREEKARLAKEEALGLAHAKEIAEKIKNLPLKIEMPAGEGGKLYGAVTSQDIQKALEDRGISLERKGIHIEEPIRKLGNYQVPLKLHHEISQTLIIQVVKKA